MNNKLAVILALIVLIFTAIATPIINNNKIKNINLIENIRIATENTKVIDANTHHNQALDVIDYARKNNIEIPSTLINFDTHSDIFLNTDLYVKKQDEVHIGNWINELLAKNPEINEIYWVLPDEEAKNPIMRILFAQTKIPGKDNDSIILYGNIRDKMNLFHFIFNPIYKKTYTQEFLIEPKTAKIMEYTEDKELLNKYFENVKNLRKFKVVSCTTKTLPDFKNRKVFLSVDSDYTSNSGFDTIIEYKFIKSQYNVLKTFQTILQTVENKNINPEIISLTVSPLYLPKRHHLLVQEILQYIVHTSGKQDALDTYTRANNDQVSGKIKNLFNIIYF